MKITALLTDDAVLEELGARIARRRIEQQMTQAAVAEQAGIAKRTLERLEAGQSSQLVTLVRVLRVLDAAAGLDSMIPETGPRPMDLLRHNGRVRQRASGKRTGGAKAANAAAEEEDAAQVKDDAKATPWRWDDDQ